LTVCRPLVLNRLSKYVICDKDRAKYEELGWLLITVIVVNFVVPIAAIVLFGRRIAKGKT